MLSSTRMARVTYFRIAKQMVLKNKNVVGVRCVKDVDGTGPTKRQKKL